MAETIHLRGLSDPRTFEFEGVEFLVWAQPVEGVAAANTPGAVVLSLEVLQGSTVRLTENYGSWISLIVQKDAAPSASSDSNKGTT